MFENLVHDTQDFYIINSVVSIIVTNYDFLYFLFSATLVVYRPWAG
jgi:hypothetical protein